MTVSAADLAFIQKHTFPVVVSLKPRLARADQAYSNQAPVNTVAPNVTGTGTVGQTLTCSTGTWLFTPAYTYQWRHAGQNIIGAVAATYVLAAGDSGKAVDCAVIATNVKGSTTQYSNNAIQVA